MSTHKLEQLLDHLRDINNDRTLLIDAMKIIYNCHNVEEETYQLIDATLAKLSLTK
jgi:hypothetical protein